MKEQERLAVISKIQERLKEKESLKNKYKDLQKLSNDPKVKQYFELLEEINRIEKDNEKYDTKEKLIFYQFEHIFRFGRNIHMDVYPCKHDIWIYEGSYYLLEDYLFNEHDKTCKEYSEDIKGGDNWSFQYNRYICLECSKQIETKDWQNFEKFHFVLKNQDEKADLGVEYYINLYYQLLYKNNIEDSKKQVIEEFNKNKSEKVKVKK